MEEENDEIGRKVERKKGRDGIGGMEGRSKGPKATLKKREERNKGRKGSELVGKTS